MQRWGKDTAQNSVVIYELHAAADAAAALTARVRADGATQLVVVAGSGVTRFPHKFLANCPKMKEVAFVAPWVQEVGDQWLGCNSLVAVEFSMRGLGALASVGNHWLRGCTSLASADFSQGFESLVYVGPGWLSDCASLIAVDLPPKLEYPFTGGRLVTVNGERFVRPRRYPRSLRLFFVVLASASAFWFY